MKVQIVAHTPIGKFVSVVGDETNAEGVNEFFDMMGKDMSYFKFNTENGTILLKKGLMENSAFEIITVEE